MEYVFNDLKYTLEKDENNIFDYDVIKELVTDYFNEFDYILGDQAYNKIRLKGFCDKNNKNFKNLNDIGKLDIYLKDYCAKGCSYFLLKKVK